MINRKIMLILLLTFLINIINISIASEELITVKNWEFKNNNNIVLDLIKNAPKARWHNNYVNVSFNSDTPEGTVAIISCIKLKKDDKVYGEVYYFNEDKENAKGKDVFIPSEVVDTSDKVHRQTENKISASGSGSILAVIAFVVVRLKAKR